MRLMPIAFPNINQKLFILQRGKGQQFLVMQQLAELTFGSITPSTRNKFKRVLAVHLHRQREFATPRELIALKEQDAISGNAGRCMLISLPDAIFVMNYYLTRNNNNNNNYDVEAQQKLAFFVAAFERWLEQPRVVQAIVKDYDTYNDGVTHEQQQELTNYDFVEQVLK